MYFLTYINHKSQSFFRVFLVVRETHSTYPTIVESKPQALMFPTLNSDGSNFLEWINDAKTLLSAEDLARTLNPQVASISAAPVPTAPTTAAAAIVAVAHLCCVVSSSSCKRSNAPWRATQIFFLGLCC